MPVKLPRIVVPSSPTLTDALERWAAAIEWAANFTGQAPVRVARGASGPVVSADGPLRKRVKLTSAGTSPGSYNAVEVYPTTGGGWAVTPGGWTGLAWEWNLANISLSNPVYVEIEWVGSASEWRFQLGSCS